MSEILSLNSLNNISITARGLKLPQLAAMESKNAIIDILNIDKVPDVHRYDLCYENGVWNLFFFTEGNIQTSNFNDYIVGDNTSKKQKTIVISLESPHKEEFQYFDTKGHIINNWGIENLDTIKPIAPAQGVTGDMLYEKFDIMFQEIESDLDKDHSYRIIIANPIPYQTSLHALHGQRLQSSYATLRNNVWKHLWDIPQIRNDFLERIIQYDADIVVNLCTAGVRKQFEETLHGWIDLKDIHFKYATASHPSHRLFKSI